MIASLIHRHFLSVLAAVAPKLSQVVAPGVLRPLRADKGSVIPQGVDPEAGTVRFAFISAFARDNLLPLAGTSGCPLTRSIIPTRSHQTVSKRFCLDGLARGIYMIRIILRVLATVIFVVIVLSR